MTDCVLCGKTMYRQTKPWWIINPDTGEVEGLAHSGCRWKLVSDRRRFLATVEAGFIQTPRPPPEPEQIQFGLKLIDLHMKLLEERPLSQFEICKVIIVGETTFKVSNIQELLNHPRVKELREWWVHGSKIISPQQNEDLETWLRKEVSI